MNSFQVTEVLSADIIRVSPKWQLRMKNGDVLTGDRVKIRGLDIDAVIHNKQTIENRLKKLLLDNSTEVQFNSPEPIYTDNNQDAIVSCSVYISQTNMLYYFPEFVYKD